MVNFLKIYDTQSKVIGKKNYGTQVNTSYDSKVIEKKLWPSDEQKLNKGKFIINVLNYGGKKISLW